MNHFLKKGIIIVLVAVFTAVTVGFSFFQPFKPDAVREAIPAGTSFIFKANNLDELLQSPVCGQLDNALGAGNSLKDLLASNDWKNLAAASEIAVADIPFRNAGEQKTWATVSWIGWRSPWLRWKFEQARDKNLKLLGKHAVWPVWQYSSPDLARGMSLTFSLTDNLFIACLSENPSDILLLLDTYDQRSPAAHHNEG
ncbi:MAG: hypothetical protein OES84_05040 [Kiritimatiellaceae bacterium]|nr:hypothetical protein [Kiritimatiellaceae bacterium]